MSTRPFTLQECKIQAEILLKSIRLTNNSDALKQLRQVPAFTQEDDLSIVNNVKLKHALLYIANKYGFDNWHNLKAYFEKTSQTSFKTYSAFLNEWFTNYKDAKDSLKTNPNKFLLPYKNQFFLCEEGFINNLGIDPQDPDWELIQHNWVEPIDYLAWTRLNNKYLALQGVKNV